MKSDRLGIIHTVLILFALALVGKAGYEQLYRGSYWTAVGQREHYGSSELPAPRGEIEDATGNTLAESRELLQIRIAPQEVPKPNRAALAQAMRMAHIDRRWITDATNPKRRWVGIPDLFLPSDVARVVAIKGVHPKAALDRVYANSAGIRRIVGRVDPTGLPQDGIELSLDNVLHGDTGSVRLPRDKSGKLLDDPTDSRDPTPGNTVILTLNRNLQDICERALGAAVDSLHATGGDIVVMNPNTGDILALASSRTDPRAVANTAVTEPYEPGSTVKPFVAAKLLTLGRAKSDEMINTFGGHLDLDGQKIEDAEEHQAMLSLREVIQHSSNVGIVRFGERLSPREKYELLRDVGFGTPTMVQLPGEATGTLHEPARWSKTSAASVVMGYELTVTPLQVVAAYSAIANGGELLEPQLVKEIRSPDGETRYEEHRRVIRRVMSPQVSDTMRQMLRAVVSGGTSTKADLQTIDVAGKSGTARLVVHGKYVHEYTASFVGLFPEDHPQFVILVKLDRPQNGYYGGIVAGGVTNIVLRAALAARDAALNLQELASSVHAPRPDTTAEGRALARQKMVVDSVRQAQLPPPSAISPAIVDTDPRTSASYVIELPSRPHVAPPALTVRPIPDVTGLSFRAAVRALHSAGFRVQVVLGAPGQTFPAAGTVWAPGRVVKLGMAN